MSIRRSNDIPVGCGFVDVHVTNGKGVFKNKAKGIPASLTIDYYPDGAMKGVFIEVGGSAWAGFPIRDIVECLSHEFLHYWLLVNFDEKVCEALHCFFQRVGDLHKGWRRSGRGK